MSKYFRYKEKKYTLLGVGKMKHPETREWVDAVMYMSSRTGDCYSREKQDFEEKFVEECACGKFNECSDSLNTCPIL